MGLISTKGLYGLNALYEMAKAYNKELIQIRQIAANANIPKNYLEQILFRLKHTGLVESVRGANGGYRLKKDPKEISVLEVLTLLEGNFYEIACNNDDPILNMLWKGRSEEVRNSFDFPLSLMVEAWEKSQKNITYQI